MSKRIMKRRVLSSSVIAISIGAALLSSPVIAGLSSKMTFKIPTEDAAKFLNDFSTQANIQILFPYEIAAKHTIPALEGTYTASEALALILPNCGLEIASQTDTTITLRAASTAAVPPVAEVPTEVIVTGTHIRGGNSTSPVHTVTRADIENSGYADIGQVIRSLPENFSGGQNPGVIAASATNLANDNYSNAATVNLRGLGTDATLVLLNGHRLSADYFFQGSDISGIPLAAIQRIEVVADGASALYGSDAVAGVANFITRRNYNGAELSGTFGGATQGGGEQKNISLLGGRAGGNGYLLGNLEYASQSGIVASQRDFTDEVAPYTTLLSPQERKSLFIGAGRKFSDDLYLTVDALVSERYAKTQPYFSDTYLGTTRTPAYNLAATLEYSLTDNWKTRVTGVAAGSQNKLQSISSGVVTASQLKNDIQYLELTADGTVARLPTGDLKMAFGGGYRRDHFVVGDPSQSNYQVSHRSVGYLYAEALAPLVEPSATRVGLKELELSLSARTENYSDFGTSTNPKVGLRYVPVDGLTMRATWGTSFKAPSFYQAYQSSKLYLFPAAILGYTGSQPNATALWLLGGNADLKPETSSSWTLGADYTPTNLKSLRLSATYFDIAYKDRVVQPVADVTVGFSNPNYAPFVTLAPSAEAQAILIANAQEFYNYSGGDYDAGNVVGILNDSYQNATAQTVTGLDVSYRQVFDLPAGTISAFANATWLRLKQQTISTVPNVLLSGTIFNAPNLKARAGLTWQDGGLSFTGLANYISGETDTGVIPNVSVASSTTIDLTLAYSLPSTQEPWRGVRIGLTASNLFDRDPPRAVSPSISVPGIYYDSTNSSIMGRYVALSLTKAW
jgi:iron complex outermembrane recepter protein